MVALAVKPGDPGADVGAGTRRKRAIIDFQYEPAAQRAFAPPPEHSVPQQTRDREMAQAGLTVADSHVLLPKQHFAIYKAAHSGTRLSVAKGDPRAPQPGGIRPPAYSRG